MQSGTIYYTYSFCLFSMYNKLYENMLTKHEKLCNLEKSVIQFRKTELKRIIMSIYKDIN